MGLNIGAVVVVSVMVLAVLGKPVKRGPPPAEEAAAPEKHSEQTGLAYDHYLRQVVDVLESDPVFRKKLELANISDIENGNIAKELEFANHTVRTALDELKRVEISRLQELARLALQNDPQGLRNLEMPRHLDLKNPHSFEMTDLKNLILKTTADLAELDKKRDTEFKEYEMEKQYEKNKHLSELSEEERKKEEHRLESLKKKHAEHPKLNHPGSKDQFEEVWEKGDHLEGQDFNPRTFFFKHDLNGDFEWTIDEVDALVQLELDKVYDPSNSPDEDDPIERAAEMNQMRKHIFDEMDKDKNYRITLKEYLKYTGVRGDERKFQDDEGWKTIDEQPVFSEEDYQRFLESHHGQPDGSVPSQDLKFQSEHGHQQQAPHDQPQLNQQPLVNQQINQQQPHVNHQNQQQQINQQQPQFNQQQQPQLNQQQQPNVNQHQNQQQQINQQQAQFNQQQQPQLNQQQPNVNQHQNHQQQPQFNQQQPQLNQQQQPNVNQHQNQQQQINQQQPQFNQQQPQLNHEG